MPVIEGFTERAARGAGGAIEGFQPRITGELRPPTGSRSALGFANDTIVTGVNSALGIGKAISDFVSVDNPVSRGLQWLIDEGEQTYTPQTRASREELFRSIDEGGWDAARGVGEFVLTSPVQAAAMAAGNFGPFGAGIKLVGWRLRQVQAPGVFARPAWVRCRRWAVRLQAVMLRAMRTSRSCAAPTWTRPCVRSWRAKPRARRPPCLPSSAR